MLKKIRRIIQTLLLLLFVYLIIETSYPLDKSTEFFLTLSPLSAIFTMIAIRKWLVAFWGAIIIIILTFFLGRFFCGWICPLGTTIDFFEKIILPKAKPSSGNNHNWKYIILIALFLLAISGVSVTGWLDPLCIAQRSYSLVVYPYMNLLMNNIFDLLYKIPLLTGISSDFSDFLINKKILSIEQPLYSNHILILALFLTIMLLSLKSSRYWCRNICPLGAMLGLISSITPYRRSVSEKCTMCIRCQAKCKMNAIEDGGKKTINQECIYCFNCKYLCPEKAISFNFTNIHKKLSDKKRTKKEELKTIILSKEHLSRRQLILTGGAIGVLALPLLELNYSNKKAYPFLLRPPGAKEEGEFFDLCIRCGACMKVCPTNGLQPALFEGGLCGLWTPQLVPRAGYCEYNCKLCSEICPTGAINAMTLEEKQKVQIGMAYINKERCIPYLRGESCMVCEEMCPIPEKAIHYRERTIKGEEGDRILKLPYIVEDLCVGCGICENKCPVRGMPAIYVTTYKKKEDSYY